MKKNSLLLIFLLFAAQYLRAQSTELFETEPHNQAYFTDAGQVFNITSQAQGPFDIQANYPGTGWNGTANDNRYIDNSGTASFNKPCKFTISAANGTGFVLKSMWLYLSTYALNLNVTGTVTVTGKLAGVTVYEAVKSNPFNTSANVANGFTLFNMANYGGQNNSGTVIDQFVITTTGNIDYVSLDAMQWQCAPLTATNASQTNISCNGGSNGTATVATTGGAVSSYNWTPGNPAGDGTATVTGLTPGTWTCTVTNACGSTASASFTITEPVILTAGTTQANIFCNGATGSAGAAPSGGTTPYTYLWSNGATGSSVTGLAAGTHSVTVTDARGCTLSKSVTIINNSLSVETSVTNLTCNGVPNGTASAAVTGGVAPYSYSWSTGGNTPVITNRYAGLHTVTVTDAAGCTVTKAANISQPPVLAATAAVTPSCDGSATASITIDATGGTGAKTFSWSPYGGTGQTAAGLVPGDYTVTVKDANNCTITRTVNVPAALTATTSQTNIFCNGGTGSAGILPSGGTAPYSYSWNNGITASSASGLTAGTYSVTVTDAKNCSVSKNVTILNNALSAEISAVNLTCNGIATGTATVAAAGGVAPYTYSWSTGGTTATVSNRNAGSHTVTVTDAAGCVVTKTVTIMQPSALAATTAVSPSCDRSAAASASVTANGGTPGYTYTWAPYGGTGPTANGLAPGDYSITVKDANNCTLIKTINIPNALTAAISHSAITCAGGTADATVVASGGRAPYTYAWSTGNTNAAATGLATGNYSVSVIDANNCIFTAAVTIAQPAALTLSPAQITASCNGENNGSAGISVSGGTAPYTYLWSSGSTEATATGLAAGEYAVIVTDANNCTSSQAVAVIASEPIIATVSRVNILCNGGTGSASVTAAGGTGGYTYLWSNGSTQSSAEDLVPGTYNVFVYDANMCYAVVGFTISEPAALYALVDTHQDITCAGTATGMADVSIWGGQPPYSFEWFPYGGTNMTAYNLSAGDFSVTVTDANGCSYVAGITITEPEFPLTAEVTTQDITCGSWNNGSASVVASGGTGNYTYTWSTGETGTTVSGLYESAFSVLVTDEAGCSVSKDFTISSPNSLMVDWTQTDASCFTNGSISLNVTGGSGFYTYQWSNGQAGATIEAPGGGYIVTVTDTNGCSTMREFYIQQPDGINVYAEATYITCQAPFATATAYVYGGQEPYAYLWSDGSTEATATGLSAGNYSVRVTDATGCSTLREVQVYGAPQMVIDATVTNVICHGAANGAIEVSVYNVEGPFTYNWSDGSTDSYLIGLSTGNYTVTVSTAQGCSSTMNFTVSQPEQLTTELSVDNITCSGTGSATVNVTGGTAPYTYSWSNGAGDANTALNLQAGNYTVAVTDANDCSVILDVIITGPSQSLTAILASSSNNSCFGDAEATATVAATGGVAPYTYSWSNGSSTSTASDLAIGEYTATVTDANGCTASVSVLISSPPGVYNDNCDAAQQIFLGTSQASTLCASPGQGLNALSCNNGLTLYDTWYKFNTGVSTVYTINADMGYTIYTGTCGTLAMVSCNAGGGAVTLTGLALNANYYIRAYAIDKQGRRDFSINLSSEGPAHLQASQCNSTVASFNTIIYSNTISGATAYRFRVINGGNAEILERPSNWFKMNMLASYGYGQTYHVDVAVKVNDTWSAYGTACTISAQGVTSQLRICGADVDNLNTIIYAQTVTLATTYRFKVVSSAGTYIIDRPSDWFKLNMLPQYSFGNTYTVSVDVLAGGMWLGYGPACTVRAITKLAATQLKAGVSCNQAVASFNTIIYADAVAGAENYNFTISSPAGTQTITRPINWFKLNMLPSYDYNVTYTVLVTASAANAFTSNAGSACTIISPAAVPLVSLKAASCNKTVASRNTAVYAEEVAGAVTYRFKIVSGAGEQIINSPNNWFKISMLTGITAGEMLTVSVMAISANGSQSAYGSTCSVTLSAAAARTAEHQDDTAIVTLKGYPNPFAESFALNLVSDSNEQVNIMVYDMLGKAVYSRTINATQVAGQKIGQNFAAGVYNLILTQGETVKTLRMVKSSN